MGKIWVQTSSGRIIHLPIVEDDINTADDPIVLPPMLSVNRCFSEQTIIAHPTLGTITFDFRPPGIIGSCNQCGHCCTHPESECLATIDGHPENCGYIYHEDLDLHVCQHLVIDKWRKFPQAGNTSCVLYGDILNTYKGCAYPPKTINPLWINCGYSF